jgi:hypothetical protein
MDNHDQDPLQKTIVSWQNRLSGQPGFLDSSDLEIVAQ